MARPAAARDWPSCRTVRTRKHAPYRPMFCIEPDLTRVTLPRAHASERLRGRSLQRHSRGCRGVADSEAGSGSRCAAGARRPKPRHMCLMPQRCRHRGTSCRGAGLFYSLHVGLRGLDASASRASASPRAQASEAREEQASVSLPHARLALQIDMQCSLFQALSQYNCKEGQASVSSTVVGGHLRESGRAKK